MIKIIISIFFPLITHATISEFSIDSTTVSATNTINGATYVFGGVAGSCTGTSSGPCDSCSGGSPPTACNNRRVHGALSLSMSFKSTESGNVCVMTSGSSPSIISGPIAYTANSTATITVNWDTLCTDVAGSTVMPSACATTGITSSYSKQYDVGIDKDGGCSTIDDKTTINVVIAGISDLSGTSETASIQDFRVHPGDEKVYLRNITSYSSDSKYSPERGSADITQIGVFYTQGDCTNFNNIVNNTPTKSFTSVSSSGDLGDNRVRGLTNGTEYVFRMAAIDEAGNIGFFTDPTGTGSTFACTNNTHTATPDEVYGLLEDEKNCFIATAAYGSILDPHVQIFRNFRDQFLRSSNVGKRFIGFYYKNSPPIAQFISDHNWLRILTRILLLPFWAIAFLYTQAGVLIANLVLGSAILFLIIFKKRVKA